jgi:hypothetical protein
MNECNLVKKPLGLGDCPKMPAYFKQMMTTKKTWFIPAATLAQGNAAVLAFIQAAILAKDVYLWPQMFSSENQSEETTYQSTPLGKRKVRDGFYEWLINFSDSLCSHKAMYTHRATSGRVIFIDTDNQLNGTFDASENFYGLSVQMLNTEKMMPNTGDAVAMSPVRITLADNLEFDRDGALIQLSGLNTLNPLTEAKLTVVSAEDDEIVVDVTVACDGTALEGLTAEDFLLLDEDGEPVVISGLVEDPAGRYTLTVSGYTGGTINLVAPDELTVEAYEGFEKDVVVVS